jgi:predicted dinucleotide-binding enzyme
MKVGILGTGDVGKALGKGFIALGHEVLMGAREAGNPKAASFAKENRAKAGTFADAAKFGEIVLLATLGTANESVVKAAGADNFKGKIVVDTTNPLDTSSGAPKLAIGHTDSGGEQVQRLLPGAKVVKAFNTVGNGLFFKPELPGGPPDMFIAGDDAAAKGTVGEILTAFGWRTVDLGGLTAARYLEPLAMVWITHMFKTGSGDHAFAFLRK